MAARPQQSFGPYHLIDRVSVGGMAEVFQARFEETGSVVAIKRILPNVAEDEEFIELFHDEATIASQLDHPNITKIYDVGQVDGSHYIALEFVDGKPLRTLIDRAHANGQTLPVETMVYVIREVSRGLAYAHDRKNTQGQPLNIVHRDVSPQNILISYDGRVKLIDFGIAKAAGKITRTQAGMIKGKVGYMSPEQVLGGHIDRRADIYALGICLWEALTAVRLYDGNNELAVMNKIRSETVLPPSRQNPRIPAGVDPIVLKALAKDPNQRYATATDFEADLRAFAGTLRPADAPALAGLMRQMFPAEATRASQENNGMSEKGSDLDVFDGLAKKSNRPSAPASGPSGPRAPTPPPPAKKTLLGLPPPLPPGPGGARPSGPPGAPPPSLRASGAPPPSLRSGPPGPPPSRAPSIPGPPSRAPGLPPPPRTPSGSPGPLPPKPPPAAAAAVDMDWDDEDEKTAIFDKQGEEPSQQLLKPGPAPAAGVPSQRLGGAAALLTSSGNTAPPGALPSHAPQPVPSAPPGVGFPSGPPSMGPQSMPGAGSMPPSMQPMPAPMQYPAPAPSGGAGRMVLLAAVAILAIGLIAAMAVFFMPRNGTIIVTVAGPGNKSVDTVQVFVDGTKRCDTSPCKVTELKTGTHMIKVSAAGYQATADQAVKVQTGEDAVLNVTLSRASEGTGIRVSADTIGAVRLAVDGSEVGALPQELKDLTPGEHVLKISGERYETWEKRITVEEGKVQTIEPKLKVVKGLATIKAGNGALGARVLLVSGNERRPVPKLPIKIDITTDKPWSIIATRTGFEDFKQDITFQDGKAEETFVVEMYEKGKKPPPKPPTGGQVNVGGGEKPPTGGEKPVAASGTGTLNINSIPVSNVILDGRPLGTTPKVGLSVPAGPHTVVFVHPEHGRKTRGVTVPAGGSITAAVRFP